MQLTMYTDYSLRVLAYLSMKEESATITEVAEYFDISRNHLVKVVHNLSQQNFIQTTRGKSGGMKLARQAEEINIGDVVRKTEPNFHIVECFNKEQSHCSVEKFCALKGVLNEAKNKFLEVLDQYTVADILTKESPVVVDFSHRIPPSQL